MKTCPNCKREVRDVISRCECGHEFKEWLTPLPPTTPTNPRHIVGAILIGIGIIMVLGFALAYDTTVAVSSVAGIPGDFDHVQNMGLEFNRLIGVLIGLALGLGGTILLTAAPQRN